MQAEGVGGGGWGGGRFNHCNTSMVIIIFIFLFLNPPIPIQLTCKMTPIRTDLNLKHFISILLAQLSLNLCLYAKPGQASKLSKLYFAGGILKPAPGSK